MPSRHSRRGACPIGTMFEAIDDVLSNDRPLTIPLNSWHTQARCPWSSKLTRRLNGCARPIPFRQESNGLAIFISLSGKTNGNYIPKFYDRRCQPRAPSVGAEEGGYISARAVTALTTDGVSKTAPLLSAKQWVFSPCPMGAAPVLSYNSEIIRCAKVRAGHNKVSKIPIISAVVTTRSR